MKKTIAIFKKAWKLIVFIILFALAFAYAMFEGGFVSWFLFYSFLPFCLFGIGLTAYSLKDFQVTRRIEKGQYTAGETIKSTLTLQRRFPFPLLYIVVEEQISEQLFLASKKRKFLLLPGMRRKLTYSYRLDNVPRGEHHFTSIRLKTGDLLGLVEKEMTVRYEDKILVYPAIVAIPNQNVQNRFDQGVLASRKRLPRESTLATGVREYQSGDRFSWINWKATAKRNEIMTKEFEQHESLDVFIMMDRSPHPQFEAIVSFTASLIDGMLQSGEQMTFLSTGADRVYIPLRGGSGQRTQILYHLSTVKADSAISFHEAIASENLLHQQYMIMMVVGTINKQLLQKLAIYASSRREIVVFLVTGSGTLLNHADRAHIEMARLQNVQVKIFQENEVGDVFLEVNA